MKIVAYQAVAVASLVFGIIPANAVTVNFAGSFGSSGPYALGSTFSGSFSYNAATSALAGSDATTAVYDALTSLSVSVVSGASTYTYNTAGAPEVQIGNLGTTGASVETSDRFAVVARSTDGLNGPTVSGQTITGFILRLDDLTGTVFGAANTGLPTTLDLSKFQSSSVFFNFSDSSAIGTVTRLTTTAPSAAPEPAAWMFMICGFGLVGATLRSRRTRINFIGATVRT